ncbi:MAG: tetratricopeptide repeat protein [Cyanobacteria bacterium]|jgi:serine/threonine protein kinase|nr:tetratricopeptide repeat protein [Cyanobacteria bacterium GSL.Bin1]
MINKKLKNRYTIIQEVRQGGFGFTYLAQDENNVNSLCIIKRLNPDNADISTAKRLFQREAETLKELKQADQIPEFIEYFEEEGNYYIAQEYIEGKTLDQLIGENWDSESLSRFLWDVLSVLEKLHKSNIIHRDIKPSNLIKRDRNAKIVVIDFGAVKQLDYSQNIPSSPQENRALNPPIATQIATAEYAPLEQKRGQPLLNSDIYALGMTALQLLTKLNPIEIERDNNDNLIFDHAFDNVDRPLLNILNKMVKKNPQERYQSASEVLRAIDLRKKEPQSTVISKATPHQNPPQTTDLWLSNADRQPAQPTEPLASPFYDQSSHNINYASTIPLSNGSNSNGEEKNIPRDQQHSQRNYNHLNNNEAKVNTTILSASTKPKVKLLIIPLSVLGLIIIIISELISPWIRPAYYFYQGNRLLEEKKASDALDQFYKVTSFQNNSFRGWKGQGDALLTLGRTFGAISSYEKALSIQPNDLKTLNNLGKAYYERGDYEKALEFHQQVLAIESQNAEAFSGQGVAYLGLKEYEKSLSAFDEAKRIKPNEPDIWLKQAIALKALNRPEEATELYREALNVYDSTLKNRENDPILWSDRGLVLQQLNRQQEALDSYEQALAVDEDFYEALLGKANTLVVLQKPEEALSTLKEAAEIRPQDYHVWYTQGTILEQVLKRHEEAFNALNKATQLNPRFAPAWLNKGLSLISLKRYEDALVALDQAKVLDPTECLCLAK